MVIDESFFFLMLSLDYVRPTQINLLLSNLKSNDLDLTYILKWLT